MKGQRLTGWLTPDGVFLACEYGKHLEMANVIVNKGRMHADKQRANQVDKHPLLQFNDVFLRRVKCYIPLGVQLYGGNSFLDLHIDRENNKAHITDAQIRWFRDNYDKLTVEQQKMLIKWVEGFDNETNLTLCIGSET